MITNRRTAATPDQYRHAMKRSALPVVVLLTLALGGCGGGGQPKAAPAPAATSAPATTPPAAGALIREQAAQRYLAIMKPYGNATDAFDKRCGEDDRYVREGGETFKTESQVMANLRACSQHLAVANRQLLEGLRTTRWPADVQPDINNFMDQMAAQQYGINGLSRAKSSEEYVAIWTSMPGSTQTPQLIRARLGLPRAPEPT